MPPASSKFKRNIGESLYLNSDQDILFFRNVGFGTEKPLEFIHVDSNVYIRDSVGIGTAIDRSLGGGAPALQVGGVARFDGTIGVGTASVVAGARLQVSGGTLITEHVVPGGAGGAGAFNVGSASTRYGRLYVSDAGVDISGWRMLANTTADYLEIREASSELAGMLAGSAYASNAVGIGTTFVDEGIGLAVHEGSMYVRGNVGIGTVIPRADLDIQTIKGWNLTQQLSHGTWAVGDAVSVSEDGTYLVTGTNDGRSVLIWALVAAGPAGTGSKWVFDTRIAPEWSEGMNMPGYGRSLDLTTDATRLIVGAPTETTGTARIYARSAGSPSTWSLMGDGVLGPSGSLSSGFGTDVAISRNGLYAAVTSPTEDSLGVVYIYFYSGGSWALQQRIVGPSVGGAAQFGWSIELTADGSRLFVGRQSPESVLIYNRTGTTWSQAGLLVAPDATGVDIFEFGRSVSVSTDGAVLVVGAPARNSARGAVYVWRNDVFAQRLDGSVVSGRLGDRVDIDANGRVIVANEYLFKWVDSGGGGGSGVWSEFHVFLQNHPHAANTGISVSDDGQAVFMSSPLEDRVYVFNELLEPYVEIRSREGSNLFLVQHDGRVGVGTDTALSGLHVQSTVYVASNLGIGTVNAMAPLHAVGGAVFSGGNVGIGTTAAASALNVQGVVSVTGSGGYLGIGTALPSASVHIVGSGGVGGAALRINEAFVVSANGALTADGATLGTATISSASVGSASNTELFVSNGLVMGSSARVRSELRVDSNVMADGNLVTLVANIGVGTENPGSFVDIRAQKFFVATSNLTGGVSEDTYGQVVAASADGNWLVVSDPTRTLTAVAQGLAIVYKWSGSAWQEWQSLTAASPAINDQFGRAMAFSADSSYLFIARQNQVFVYGLSGGQWVTDASLSEPSADAAAGFGRALEFSEVDQKLLVGAPLKNNTGVVFEYGHVGGLWTLSSTVSPGGGESGNIEFGASIHVSGSTRVIGAPGRTATGVLSAGSVFKYTWSAVGVTWSYVGVLSASSPTTNMRLGTSVAVSDNGDVVAGAPSAGYAGANSGAVVVFDSVSNAQKQVILSGTSSSFFGKALYAWSARPLIAVGASDAVRIYRRHGDSYREYQRLSGEGAAFASTAVGLAIGDVAGSVVRLWSLVYDRSFFEIRDEVSSNVFVVGNNGRIGVGTGAPMVGLDVRTTDAVLLPRGTTAQRPAGMERGFIRYNTETSQFEGLGAGDAWGSLGGVKSTDGFTYIAAEAYAGANDSNLRFVTGAVERMIVDAGGNVGIGTGAPVVGLDVRTTDAVLLPRGTTAQRPTGMERGFIRYNTETSQFEGLGAGDAWGSLGGVKSTDGFTYIATEAYAGANDSNLRFVTGAVERMIVDAGGHVGIGTGAPVVGLDVRTTDAVLLPRGTTAQRPTSTERGFIRYNTETSQFEGLGAGDAWELLGGVKSTDGFTYIAAEAYAGANDSNLRFVTGAVERMIVDAGGNVGIGTGAPVVGLDVRTTDAVLLPRGTTAQRPTGVERGFIRYNTETAQFEGRGAGDTWGSLGGVKSTDGFTYIAAEAYAGANDSNLRFVTGAVERMIVSDTGYVGIGTTQPAENLHVVGDVLATGTITASNMQIIGDVVILNTVTSNTEQLVVSNSGSGPGIKVTQTGAEPIAAFYDDGALAMIIADGGNIGIGTGAPLVALDIRRNDAILLPRGTTAQRPAGVERGFIRFNTETLQFEGLGAGDVWGALGGGSGGLQSLDTLTYITAEAYPGAGDSNLRFVTGGTQRMIVDASGNVGIGTAVPEHRLDVAGDLRATHIYTCNLNVIGQTFANYDSQLFRNRLQLAPLTQTILVDVPELFNVALSMDGLYKFEARKAEVLLNGSKLAYISAGSNDFYVSYENTSSNTLVNVVLQTPAKLNDVLDVKLWPSYLDDWNVLQPGYSLQNISYVTLNDGMVIDRSITKPLQIAPYRFTEYIASGISSNQVFQWTVNGRYVFNEGNCDVYLNGVRLVSLANSAVQDFSLNYDYYFDQTRIYFTVHQTLATGDILDVTVWPDFDETTENVKGIFYQNVSYFSRVGVSSNIVFTEGNLGIGTTAPLKKLHIEDDIIFDGVMYNRAGQAIWVPGSALEWKNVVGAHPVLTAASGMTISVDSASKRGQFKYVGNNITYNVFVEAEVTDKPGPVSGDFELGLPYVVEGGAYAVGTVVGELWLTVTTAGTPGTVTIYKAYGKTTADTSKVTVRYLNGTFEESLSGLSVGTSIRLQGTLEYRTVYVADEQPLPAAYTPELFTRNAGGYVGLNTQALPARGRFDVVETSNLPVLVLDQRGTGTILEMRSNANDVKVIVDRMGNVGIGTGAPRAKLEVSGSVIPSSNMAFDLGSSNLRWRDLYLSGNTIDLGGTMLKRDEAGGGGIKVLGSSGEDVDTTVRNLNASGYLNIGGTRLERHVTGPIMVKTAAGKMESGMFKHVYVDGTVRASNLEVLGDYVTLNTITSNTEQMVITNAGTGPGLKVTQTGAESIAEFYDDGGVLVMKVADGGNVGIGRKIQPSGALDISAATSTQRVLSIYNNGNVWKTNSSYNTLFGKYGTGTPIYFEFQSTYFYIVFNASENSQIRNTTFYKYTNGAWTVISDLAGLAPLTYSTVSSLSGLNTVIELEDRVGLLITNKIGDTSFVIDKVGNVGIGTAAPMASLHVRPNTATTGVIIDQVGAGGILDVRDGGVSKVVVDAQGNVGIGTTMTAAKVDVFGILKATGLQINDITNAFMPRGGIIMWSGSIASIPTGWSLCDGTNGTPDLRNRFIIGAGSSYAVAGTGGSSTKTLTEANMPAHSHSGTTAQAGNHRHYIRENGLAGTGSYAAPATVSGYSAYTDYAGDHTHTFTTDSKGSGTAFDILPPYFALAYIMKM